jgi:hypothetical protein
LLRRRFKFHDFYPGTSIRWLLRSATSSTLLIRAFRIGIGCSPGNSFCGVVWPRCELCSRLLSSETFNIKRSSRLAITNPISSSGIILDQPFNNQIISQRWIRSPVVNVKTSSPILSITFKMATNMFETLLPAIRPSEGAWTENTARNFWRLPQLTITTFLNLHDLLVCEAWRICIWRGDWRSSSWRCTWSNCLRLILCILWCVHCVHATQVLSEKILAVKVIVDRVINSR